MLKELVLAAISCAFPSIRTAVQAVKNQVRNIGFLHPEGPREAGIGQRRGCRRPRQDIVGAQTALVAWLVLGQSLNAPAILGLALIVTGVVVLNVSSEAAVE
jgi:hypothetical protein